VGADASATDLAASLATDPVMFVAEPVDAEPWDTDPAAAEPLGDEARTRAGRADGMGINLHDDKCDAFHIFWNPEKKKFEWWRL
jgi:hypothetical protein